MDKFICRARCFSFGGFLLFCFLNLGLVQQDPLNFVGQQRGNISLHFGSLGQRCTADEDVKNSAEYCQQTQCHQTIMKVGLN